MLRSIMTASIAVVSFLSDLSMFMIAFEVLRYGIFSLSAMIKYNPAASPIQRNSILNFRHPR